jgi:hypothetical protein
MLVCCYASLLVCWFTGLLIFWFSGLMLVCCIAGAGFSGVGLLVLV